MNCSSFIIELWKYLDIINNNNSLYSSEIRPYHLNDREITLPLNNGITLCEKQVIKNPISINVNADDLQNRMSPPIGGKMLNTP